MKRKVQFERRGDCILLSWGRQSTTLDISCIEEAWVVRLGDSFSGPNEQVLLLVEGDTFVGVGTAVPGLLLSLRPEMERLFEAGHLHCADAASLPRAWQLGVALFPSAEIEPRRRDRTDLDRAKRRWHLVHRKSLEEVFS